MKSFSLKKEIPLWAACLLPWLAYGLLASRLPAKIATHFDISGAPNAYSSVQSYVWMMFLVALGMYLLLFFVPRLDPRKANYALFSQTYWNIRLTIQVFFAIIGCIPILIGAGFAFQENKWIPMLALLLIAVLGNYMGRIRPNWFVGIRTPWTLSSETVWRKTHHMGAKWMFGTGMIGFVLIPLLPYRVSIWVMLACVLVGTLVPSAYSYFLFRKLEQGTPS